MLYKFTARATRSSPAGGLRLLARHADREDDSVRRVRVRQMNRLIDPMRFAELLDDRTSGCEVILRHELPASSEVLGWSSVSASVQRLPSGRTKALGRKQSKVIAPAMSDKACRPRPK